MPEEGLETAELKEKLDEATEHAHGAHGGEHKMEPWIRQLSLSTAIIAVLAAVASLFSGNYANEALTEKNDAIFALGEETDAWTFFQAKSIKKAIYETQADVIGAANPKLAAAFHDKATKEALDQAEPRKVAEEAKKTKQEKNKLTEHFFHIHHQFAYAVTIFQVAIALAAIAALTRRRQLWLTSLVVGAGGLFYFVHGFLLSTHG